MKTLALFLLLFTLWSCEKESSIFNDDDIRNADKQSNERIAVAPEAILYIVPTIHPSEKITIGWNLPSNNYLVSLVIKNEWDGMIVNPGLMEILPVEVSLPTTGTYSITINYKSQIDLYAQSETVYYHYDASNPFNSGIVNGIQKPQCQHDFSNFRSYAVMQITKGSPYIANFDISYTGNANYKAVLTDMEGHKLAEQNLVNPYPSSRVDTTLQFKLYTVGAFTLKIYSNDCTTQDLCTDYLYLNFHNTVIYATGDIEYFIESK